MSILPMSTTTHREDGQGKTTEAPPLDWVIVGGGIHGVHLAVRLIGEAGIAAQRIRIVDPGPTLLYAWQRCSANTGMQYLRSPAVHHLDINPWSLLRYAGVTNCRQKAEDGLFAPPYNRPSVSLFARHCAQVVSRYGLAGLHVRDSAADISLSDGGVRVTLGRGGSLNAERVLLAMGTATHLRLPGWASALVTAGVQVRHIFEPAFHLEPDEWPARVAVIGGGISAAQAAMRLVDGSRAVHLIARHALRKHQFDSDPGWIGPDRKSVV